MVWIVLHCGFTQLWVYVRLGFVGGLWLLCINDNARFGALLQNCFGIMDSTRVGCVCCSTPCWGTESLPFVALLKALSISGLVGVFDADMHIVEFVCYVVIGCMKFFNSDAGTMLDKNVAGGCNSSLLLNHCYSKFYTCGFVGILVAVVLIYLMLFMRCFGNSCNFSAPVWAAARLLYIELLRYMALIIFGILFVSIIVVVYVCFDLTLIWIVVSGNFTLCLHYVCWLLYCLVMCRCGMDFAGCLVGFYVGWFDVVLIIIYTVMVSLDSRFL
eukprot:gene2660-1658_t